MVMPTESQTEEPVQEVQAEAPTEEPTQDAPVEETEVPVAPTEGVQEQTPTDQSVPVQQPQQSQEPSQEIQERLSQLEKMEQAKAQEEWDRKVYNQAVNIQRRAEEEGTPPTIARSMAKQFVQTQKQIRDKDSETLSLVQNLQGQKEAALQILEKYGLIPKEAIADFRTIASLNSPQDMERQAKSMSDFRQITAENARLKQGQVPPQTFDDSQGAAEPSSNIQKLLTEYNSGARTQAHLDAVRSTMGRG